MVATLTWVLAPASGLIRQRSGHHNEVRLGLGIVFMYNTSILVLFGGGDGGYLNLGGVGAGFRVDQAEVRTPL